MTIIEQYKLLKSIQNLSITPRFDSCINEYSMNADNFQLTVARTHEKKHEMDLQNNDGKFNLPTKYTHTGKILPMAVFKMIRNRYRNEDWSFIIKAGYKPGTINEKLFYKKLEKADVQATKNLENTTFSGYFNKDLRQMIDLTTWVDGYCICASQNMVNFGNITYKLVV